MIRQSRIVLFVMAIAIAATGSAHIDAHADGQKGVSDRPNLGGKWTLNRTLSEFPREVGFGMDVVPRNLRSGSRGDAADNSVPYVPRNESEFEARNLKQLTDEVRTPSRHLVIEQSDALVTITDGEGHTRRFHPDGRTDYQPLDAQPVPTTAKWEAGQLVVVYKVEEGRELKYSYSCKLEPPQLAVQVQFIEKGGRGIITRVYQPTRADEPPDTPLPAPVAPATSGWVMAPPPGGVLRPPIGDPGKETAPPTSATGEAPIGSMKPDAELRGLVRLGVVVEGLDSAAAGCGLKSDAVEAAVTKSLTDIGLKVARNSDEDTYLYVYIKTATMGPGTCVSRYDATIFANTMAKMSYGTAPVLVEVSLLRKGGIIGGPAAQHGANVIAALKQYVDGFTARIREANK